MLLRMIRSALDLADAPEHIEIVVNVDDDDDPTLAVDFPAPQTIVVQGPPNRSMGLYNTQCLEQSSGDVIVLCNDDVIVRTKGWDSLIMSAAAQFADEIFLMYPNDLFKGAKLCTFPILSRKGCELLTLPFPEDYQGAFIDTHLMDVFKRLEHNGHARIHYLADVVFEHCHYRTGKSEFDETYKTRERFGDDISFLSLLSLRLAQSKNLIRTVSQDTIPSPTEIPAGQQTTYLRGVWCIFTDKTSSFSWRGNMAFHFLLRWLYQKIVRAN